MLSVDIALRSTAPCPPTPMPAILSFSLGGVTPSPPNTCRGTIVKLAAAAPAAFKNRRRSIMRALLVCPEFAADHRYRPASLPFEAQMRAMENGDAPPEASPSQS